jgi:hypothetical protein
MSRDIKYIGMDVHKEPLLYSLLQPGFVFRNAWACSGRMSALRARRFTFGGLGRVAR